MFENKNKMKEIHLMRFDKAVIIISMIEAQSQQTYQYLRTPENTPVPHEVEYFKGGIPTYWKK